MIRHICAGCSLLFVLLSLPIQVSAQETPHARDITQEMQLLSQTGFVNTLPLFDGNATFPLSISPDSCLTLSHPDGIGSAYLIFDTEPESYTITDTDSGESHRFGTDRFLHEFLDLKQVFGHCPTTIAIAFENSVMLNEITLFSPGLPPEYVQQWQRPKEGKTDLALFSAHGDDEQLFFAGLLPYYARERELEVLVVYLTNHRNLTNLRCHEMLDGLWSVGVTTYPVFGSFGDHYCHSAESAYRMHNNSGDSEDTLLRFLVEQLRRYRPQVAVGHDIHGEYGHGQHRMYADLLCRSLELSKDPSQFPDLASQWGTWDVPKTYLHLWPENPVVMDWDQPMSRFDGMTPFQVTQQLGFPCHKSQQWSFAWFLRGYDKATEIPKYSPCQYGLYRSTIGPDLHKNDLFENLTSYAQQDKAAAIAARQENIRIARQTAAKATFKQLHKKDIQEEALYLQRQEAQAARKRHNIIRFSAISTILAALSMAVLYLQKRRK